MKIRAKANGNIIEADDEAAKVLIAAGIYEAYDEKKDKAETADAGQPKRRKSQK